MSSNLLKGSSWQDVRLLSGHHNGCVPKKILGRKLLHYYGPVYATLIKWVQLTSRPSMLKQYNFPTHHVKWYTCHVNHGSCTVTVCANKLSSLILLQFEHYSLQWWMCLVSVLTLCSKLVDKNVDKMPIRTKKNKLVPGRNKIKPVQSNEFFIAFGSIT